MEPQKTKKLFTTIFFAYIIVMLIFFLLVNNQLKYRVKYQEIVSEDTWVGEITEEVKIEQHIITDYENIDEFSVKPHTYGRENAGKIFINVFNEETKELLLSNEIDVGIIENDKMLNLIEGSSINNIKNVPLIVEITSNSQPSSSITVFSSTNGDGSLLLNKQETSGALVYKMICHQEVKFVRNFFVFLGITTLVLSIVLVYNIKKIDRGESTVLTNFADETVRYRFLLKQLVSRDFKTKYKRSILGIFWSFLNPLLTMLVQYIIFSTLFRQSIENFALYLLIGVVFFNFFTETCNIGIGAIADNAPLLTKVYIPKYIFPISRVMSSMQNFLLSLIPLVIVMLLTGTPLRKELLLVTFPIICIMLFSMGVVMFLSSIMVFFRDMRFIWNIISMLWMYATPIFYPETIVPAKIQIILKLNPLYHFIRFSRDIIMDGVSPAPISYFYCFVFAVGAFIVGVFTFRKLQDKFILYI